MIPPANCDVCRLEVSFEKRFTTLDFSSSITTAGSITSTTGISSTIASTTSISTTKKQLLE